MQFAHINFLEIYLYPDGLYEFVTRLINAVSARRGSGWGVARMVKARCQCTFVAKFLCAEGLYLLQCAYNSSGVCISLCFAVIWHKHQPLSLYLVARNDEEPLTVQALPH